MENPIITSPVLIPYTPDCEYQYGEEVLPPEKIEQLANSFNKYKIIDLQHEFTKRLINNLEPIPRGKLLKSYIATESVYLTGLDGLARKYPEGTWIISVEITDPEAKKLYNQNILTGLSITVKEKEHADAIIEYLNNNDIPFLPDHIINVEKGFYKKPKRILMKDVVNPVAFTVSLVKSPCVYEAKFCKNSCLIVNQNKLKENKILNLKEKIKNEINNLIDGLDVEESIKEDVEEETEVVEETIPDSVEEESVKEDGDGESQTTGGESQTTSGGSNTSGGSTTGGASQTTGGDSTTGGKGEGETESGETSSDDSEDEEDNSTSKGKVKEAKKESLEESSESESDKVLYLAQEDVEGLISTTLRRYADEIEQMVFDGIQEALDDYLFTQDMSYKEEGKPDEEGEEEAEGVEETEEVVEEEESQKYATTEMVQSMFEEQFASFKSSLMDNIKQAQKESIKSYSKAINQTDDGFKKETQKETFKPRVERDFNGCRIRKR